MFESRYRHVPGLLQMGADITVDGRSAVVKGVKRLRGARVIAPDLRGGGALAVAALGAEGETVLSGLHHVDRGYESLEEMFRRLGGNVSRR
jgi:UDP-N-acetylglucosamine 1-carboxyvinyltransferase